MILVVYHVLVSHQLTWSMFEVMCLTPIISRPTEGCTRGRKHWWYYWYTYTQSSDKMRQQRTPDGNGGRLFFTIPFNDKNLYSHPAFTFVVKVEWGGYTPHPRYGKTYVTHMPYGRRWIRNSRCWEMMQLGVLLFPPPAPLAPRPDGMLAHCSVHLTVFFFFGTRIPWWAPIGTRGVETKLNPNPPCVYNPVWRTCSCVFPQWV